MNQMYELGMVAAIADLHNAAAEGDPLAEKIAMALPDQFQELDEEMVKVAWDYQEKLAKGEGVWEGVKKYHKTMGDDFMTFGTGRRGAAREKIRDAKKKFKDTHKDYKGDMGPERDAFKRQIKKDFPSESWGERGKALGKGTLRASPYIAGVGAAGGGAYYGLRDKKKR